ncbi:MAG: radical SAM protein [Deltaproteobacteria bacterium]|jgi:MoaA/NifB/PqqE/SkfB family radical SAM enzyme|nr:radical SAM protein [Deltaproteobacteria bacterium]
MPIANKPIKRSKSWGLKSSNRKLSKLFGAPFDSYRARFHRAEKGLIPPFPLHLDVDITTRCNLRCPMCPAGNPAKSPFDGMARDLDIHLYRRALQEGARNDLCSIRIGITGEPLIANHPDSWVLMAKEAGVLDIALITNGQKLTGDMSLKLIKAGLTRLMISVDATNAETYKKMRPGGDFELLIANIMEFLRIRKSLKSPLPLLRVSFVVTEKNQGQMESFAAIFSTLADSLSFQSYIPMMEKKAYGPQLSAGGTPTGGLCPDPFTRMSLYANGSLYPCCSDFGRLAPIGNLSSMSLKEAWTHPLAQLARRLQPQSGSPCALCRGLSALRPQTKALLKEGAL